MAAFETTRTQFSVRPYREGDEHQILRGFNSTFNLTRNNKHWDWKFKKNPYSPPIASVGVTSEEKLLGQYAVLPICLNASGSQVRAGQIVDLFVLTDFKAHGFFFEGARHADELCAQNRMQVLFTFPNQRSLPGFLQLGWKRVTPLASYLKRLSIRNELNRHLRSDFLAILLNTIFRAALVVSLHAKRIGLRRRIETGNQFFESNSVPSDYAEFWNEMKAHETYSVWKDSAYLKWRYEENPDHQFDFVGLRKAGKIVAFGVLAIQDRKATLCEFMVKGKNVQEARYFLCEVQRFAFKRHCLRMVFSGSDSGFFAEAFTDFSKIPSSTVFLAKGLGSEEKEDPDLALPDNWTVTLGDGDSL